VMGGDSYLQPLNMTDVQTRPITGPSTVRPKITDKQIAAIEKALT